MAKKKQPTRSQALTRKRSQPLVLKPPPPTTSPPMSLAEAGTALTGLFLTMRLARYRIGRILAVVRDLKLYKESGHRSFAAWLESLKGATSRTLYKYIALAESIPGDVAEAYDPERIEYALALIAPEKGDSAAITLQTFKRLMVQVLRDGEYVEVKFEKTLTEELLRAAAEQRASLTPEPSPEVRAAQGKVQARLGNGSTMIGEVEVRKRRGQEGIQIFVPLDRVDDYLKKLK